LNPRATDCKSEVDLQRRLPPKSRPPNRAGRGSEPLKIYIQATPSSGLSAAFGVIRMC
jgi:hypothetical protein